MAGERVIAFRDYDVEFVALCPLSFLLSCNAREDEKEKGTTERKIAGSHETFREDVVEKHGNYGQRKDPRAQFNVINRGKMEHRIIIFLVSLYLLKTKHIWKVENGYYRVKKRVARIYNGMENVSVRRRNCLRFSRFQLYGRFSHKLLWLKYTVQKLSRKIAHKIFYYASD